MEWISSTLGGRWGLRVKDLWRRAVEWVRRVFGRDKQRPSPLKELKAWRI